MHIIMLIPLNNNTGLTTISLSLLHLFKTTHNKQNIFKSILYISCQNNIYNDATIVINKFFSCCVHVLKNTDFSDIIFNSNEYLALLNRIIEICYEKKSVYDIILIEGISNKYNIDSYKINYDIAQNVSAKVVLIDIFSQCSLAAFQKKEEEIKFFLDQYPYKHFLGLIFNKINAPFIEKNTGFIKTLKILRTYIQNKKRSHFMQQQIEKSVHPIISCIPWNQDLMRILLIDICYFLHAIIVNKSNMKARVVKKIIIFDSHDKNILEKMNANVLTILPANCISIFIEMLHLSLWNDDFGSILLISEQALASRVVEMSKILIQMDVPVFFVQYNIIEILHKLQNFHGNINMKDKDDIVKIQKYISRFLHLDDFITSKIFLSSHVFFSPREFLHHLKILSRKSKKYIILPEAYDIRILQAVSICHNLNIAKCVLLGDPQKIYNIAKDQGIDLNHDIEIINPKLIRKKYVPYLIDLRKHKGINEDSAYQQLKNNTVLATLMLALDRIDGVVSGAVNTTANTIRPALQLIKSDPISPLVSSVFFMLLPKEVLIYGDCAVNIDPTAEELADIAIQASYSAQMLGIEPRIAMLSYSTGDSGMGKKVEKIRQATSIVRIKRPDLMIEGPIQYDAAVSKKVAELKIVNSSLSGRANIFIFPDLNAGNITYKAVQRSAKLVSIGPMLQGLRKPVNDLSRGALVDDIIYTIALTSIQAMS